MDLLEVITEDVVGPLIVVLRQGPVSVWKDEAETEGGNDLVERIRERLPPTGKEKAASSKQ